MTRMRALVAVSALALLVVAAPASAQAADKDASPTYSTNGFSYRP